MRLFFAVLLPDDVLSTALKYQSALRRIKDDPGLRWCGSDQLHFTLRFMGEVNMQRATRAVETAGIVRERIAPFNLTLGGAGAFPNIDRPSVLWLGLKRGAEELGVLAQSLESTLAERGFRGENRAFQPHLSLARIKTWNAEKAAISILIHAPSDEIASMYVDRFALVKSELKPTGAIYTVVDQYILTGSAEQPAALIE